MDMRSSRTFSSFRWCSSALWACTASREQVPLPGASLLPLASGSLATAAPLAVGTSELPVSDQRQRPTASPPHPPTDARPGWPGQIQASALQTPAGGCVWSQLDVEVLGFGEGPVSKPGQMRRAGRALRKHRELACREQDDGRAGTGCGLNAEGATSSGRALTPAPLALGSKQYSAAIAFTLALFSHLVNHVNMRLQAELEDGENPVPALQSDGPGVWGDRVRGGAGWAGAGRGGRGPGRVGACEQGRGHLPAS